jgi:hypothetical protein
MSINLPISQFKRNDNICISGAVTNLRDFRTITWLSHGSNQFFMVKIKLKHFGDGMV